MVRETKIFLAHLLVSTAERERGGLLGGPDVFRRLPRGSLLKMPSSSWTSLKIREKAFTVIFPVTMSCDFQSRPDGFHQTFHWRRRHPKCPKFSLASLNSKHKSYNRSQYNRSRTLLQKYHKYFCNKNYSNSHPPAWLDKVVEYQS